MSVQRWTISQSIHSDRDDSGNWVRYDDHVAALAEAVNEGALVGYMLRAHRTLTADDRTAVIRECIAVVEDRRVPWPIATGDLVNEGVDLALTALRALIHDGGA